MQQRQLAVKIYKFVQTLNFLLKAKSFRPRFIPGYIIHESAVWSDVHKSWFFLPRRASREVYDEVKDEQRATNILFKCSEDFKNIKVTKIGKKNFQKLVNAPT